VTTRIVVARALEQLRGWNDRRTSAGCMDRRRDQRGGHHLSGGDIAVDQVLRHLTRRTDLAMESVVDYICVSRNGLQPPFLPQAGTWTTPCIGENAITDHSGAFADLYLPKLP
jgi:hypothetical protein